MAHERRKGAPPIPDNLEALLNSAQRVALHELQSFGWAVLLVRRPLFTTPLVVLKSPDGGKLATIDEDGGIDHQPDIVIR